MQPIDGGPVWQGFWDVTTSAAGNYTIEVRASGTAANSDKVVSTLNPDLSAANFAEIIGTWSSGIWYYDVAASKWTKGRRKNKFSFHQAAMAGSSEIPQNYKL